MDKNGIILSDKIKDKLRDMFIENSKHTHNSRIELFIIETDEDVEEWGYPLGSLCWKQKC